MVSPTTWILTLVLILGLMTFDYVVHVRSPHTPTVREAARWTAIYVGFAAAFGVGTWQLGGSKMGLEFFAGYITELSLSVDNLFVFLIIMASFKVPRAYQQKVLEFGIVFSLIARSAFIFLGVALINTFSWVFYLFGLILLITAGNLLKPESEDSEDEANNIVIRTAKRLFRTTPRYEGDRLFTHVDGKRLMTPMLLVMIAIGGTDVMFALDSIPAIFGLTQNAYTVFTAVAFSLMGLRQLYFLIDGLLDRLIYLKYGLAVILGFIGVKLILHALHENNLPFINGGENVKVIEITTVTSLLVIVASLAVVVVASLLSPKGKVLTTFRNAKRHAVQYLDLDYEADPAIREANYARLMTEEAELAKVPEKYDHLLKGEQQLLDLLDEVHRVHGDHLDRFPDAFGADASSEALFDTARYRPVDDEISE